MANPRHLECALDKRKWAEFRSRHPRARPDLRTLQKAEHILPIRLDEAVLEETGEPWAGLAHSKHISDFSRWHEPAVFKRQFDLLTTVLRRS
jgi:hypothetical protein